MNDAQRGVAATTLLRLNRTIWELERLLAIEEVREPMFAATSRLLPVRRRKVEERIAQIRAEIAQLAKAFEFEPERGDLFSSIWGELNSHWVSLEDAKSPSLSRYGGVDAAVPRVWDPGVERLISLVNALTRELRT